MKVIVIDYRMGNLGSVKRSLEECGATVVVSDDPKDLSSATHIVLPGVGAFRDGIENLTSAGWVPVLQEQTEKGVPMLGICLGMQILADKGFEGGETPGLGMIPGEVKRLIPDSPQTRIPHVGWNEIHENGDAGLFSGIPNGTDFYFVHSYHFIPRDARSITATTPYCGEFVSAIHRDNIFGVQFHPEKSSRPGFQLLRNFLKT